MMIFEKNSQHNSDKNVLAEQNNKNEIRKMVHERVSSQTPVLADSSLNMDTEAIEGQEYDLNLSKFTSRVVETYRNDDTNRYASEYYSNGHQKEDMNEECGDGIAAAQFIQKSGLDTNTVENLLNIFNNQVFGTFEEVIQDGQEMSCVVCKFQFDAK